jgi:uncharacterized protein (DUF1684 family)
MIVADIFKGSIHSTLDPRQRYFKFWMKKRAKECVSRKGAKHVLSEVEWGATDKIKKSEVRNSKSRIQLRVLGVLAR